MPDVMITDDNGVVQTQQQTQSTQEASQPDYIVDVHLWGFLIPCSSNLRRIDFQKIKPKYMIGRNAEQTKNDIILPGMKISESRRVLLRVLSFLTRLARLRQLSLCHRVGRRRNDQVCGEGHGPV